MKEPALVILKPDAMAKGIEGNILLKFAETNLDIIATRVFKPSRKLVEEHYKDIKNQPFFRGTVDFFLGKFHKENKVLGLVYFGEDAIVKCRKLAGATSPEEASPHSIRGAYGKISPRGIYENVIHVSSSRNDAKREIKLWFKPDEIVKRIYPTKKITINNQKIRIWL